MDLTEKMRKELLHAVKQDMKRLASNRGLSKGTKSMDNDDLEELLRNNLVGFNLEDNRSDASITISWLDGKKETGIKRTIDFSERKIYSDEY